MKLDFLPEKIKNKRKDLRRRIFFAYIFVAVCLVLTSVWYINNLRIEHTEDNLAHLDMELDGMNQQLDQLLVLEKKLAGLKLKQRIDTNLGTRVNALDVLKELGNILPENMALTDLRIETQPVILKFKFAKTGNSSRAMVVNRDKKINRVKLIITGISDDNVSVANFIADLSASRLFEEVNMGYSKRVKYRGQEAKEFQANCYVMR